MSKSTIKPMREIAVAASFKLVESDTTAPIQDWTVKSTVDKKGDPEGRYKDDPSTYQGYVFVGKDADDKWFTTVIEAGLFRALEEDTGITFFEVEDDNFLLINTRFGIAEGELYVE